MKYLFAGLAVLCFIGIGIFIGKELSVGDPPPVWQDSAIKKVNKHGLVEFSRSWSKTIEDDEGVGGGIIEYQWHFTYLIGIDVSKDWDWQIKRKDGIITVTVPPLVLLNEPQFSIDEKHEFNEANGDRQQRMDERIKIIGLKSIHQGTESVLKNDSQVYEHAKLSLEAYLLNLLNQANPESPSSHLEVTFI